MKKRNSRLLACALAVVLCMTAFSIPTFAAGYYASNETATIHRLTRLRALPYPLKMSISRQTAARPASQR